MAKAEVQNPSMNHDKSIINKLEKEWDVINKKETNKFTLIKLKNENRSGLAMIVNSKESKVSSKYINQLLKYQSNLEGVDDLFISSSSKFTDDAADLIKQYNIEQISVETVVENETSNSLDFQDTDLSNINKEIIFELTKYYAVIGAGFGILGIILISQLGGGGLAGGIIGGILSLIVISYAILSGPIIASFAGYLVDKRSTSEPQAKIIDSIIANGTGYIAFGIIVGILLAVGVSVILDGGSGATSTGGGSSVGFGQILKLIILMMVPTALVGGGVTAILNYNEG